jgi:ligand-binding sensor domain-containing protein
LADLTLTALAIDPRGVLWIGAMDGLYGREPDVATRAFSTAEGLPNTSITTLL